MTRPTRRTVLQTAAMMTVSNLALAASSDAGTGSGARASLSAGSAKPGDFAFLTGEWRISHRRLKGTTWDEFKGEATCFGLLNGIGSVEELRIPERDFSGMGLRLLDVTKRTWCDYWVNGKDGILTPPPMTGVFIDGAGVFTATDEWEGKPLLVRGVWDRITPTSCRWHQASSTDDGKTWVENWFMDWRRVKR